VIPRSPRDLPLLSRRSLEKINEAACKAVGASFVQLGGIRPVWMDDPGRELDRYAAPAMYRATRPHVAHFNVTCERGNGGKSSGERSMGPEHDGQLSGDPDLSLAIRLRACAGLYVAGRGLRMVPPKTTEHPGKYGSGTPKCY
jgi:hypothetical protein